MNASGTSTNIDEAARKDNVRGGERESSEPYPDPRVPARRGAGCVCGRTFPFVRIGAGVGVWTSLMRYSSHSVALA